MNYAVRGHLTLRGSLEKAIGLFSGSQWFALHYKSFSEATGVFTGCTHAEWPPSRAARSSVDLVICHLLMDGICSYSFNIDGQHARSPPQAA